MTRWLKDGGMANRPAATFDFSFHPAPVSDQFPGSRGWWSKWSDNCRHQTTFRKHRHRRGHTDPTSDRWWDGGEDPRFGTGLSGTVQGETRPARLSEFRPESRPAVWVPPRVRTTATSREAWFLHQLADRGPIQGRPKAKLVIDRLVPGSQPALFLNLWIYIMTRIRNIHHFSAVTCDVFILLSRLAQFCSYRHQNIEKRAWIPEPWIRDSKEFYHLSLDYNHFIENKIIHMKHHRMNN